MLWIPVQIDLEYLFDIRLIEQGRVFRYIGLELSIEITHLADIALMRPQDGSAKSLLNNRVSYFWAQHRSLISKHELLSDSLLSFFRHIFDVQRQNRANHLPSGGCEIIVFSVPGKMPIREVIDVIVTRLKGNLKIIPNIFTQAL